jgi:hypothetical protein
VAWNNGNMYADKNGNVYSYNQSSGAQKYNSSSGSWQSVNKPASNPAYGAYAPAQPQWQNRAPAAQPYWGGSPGYSGGNNNWANRTGYAQSVGSQRFSSWGNGGGGGWGGYRGGRGRR